MLDIRLDSFDKENKYGVIDSIKDLRNISKLQYIVAFKRDLYFTPHFLKYFDHSYCSDIEYLKIVTKFLSIQCGFMARSRSILTKRDGNGKMWYIMQFKCTIGTNLWHESKNRKRYLEFSTCPFFMEYTIEQHYDPVVQKKFRF
jgi:hypothetical protein